MEGVTIIKIIAGIILYSLFFYQMYTAVKRMIDPTYSFVLDQTSFDDLDPKPLITVCKKDQFNVEKAVALSYDNMFDFLLGNTSKHFLRPSWGDHENQTFQQTIDSIYGSNKASVSVDDKTSGNTFAHEDIFLANKGKCKVYEHVNETYFSITFSEERDFSNGEVYEVFITDPNARTSFSLLEQLTTGDKITVDKNSLGNQLAYTIQIEYVKKISNCNNYDNTSKIECVESKAMEDIGSELGCLPPWMSEKFACGNSTLTFTSDEKYLGFFIKVYDVLLGFPIYNGVAGCLDACKEQKIKVAFSSKLKRNNKIAEIVFKFDEPIKVMSEENNYTFWDFIVEVGSALGLWIGYSALDLVTLVADACNSKFNGPA